MSDRFPGWVTAGEAVARFGIDYQTLRKLVADGVFTRGRFSAAKERPPIYVRAAELRAWKRGGVAAVEEYRRGQVSAEATHELGGSD